MTTKPNKQAGERTHTPGPWHVENETTCEGLLRTWVLAQSGGAVMTFAFLPEHAKSEPEQYEEAQANARLIAAAPELLVALTRLRKAEVYYATKALTENQAAEECVEFILAQEHADVVLAKAGGAL